MGIGAKLKEARDDKGLSLENIQETTKIQKRYLTAIERGDYHILPGKFYAKAFIKEYALAVDLDPDELMLEHETEIPSTDENDSIKYARVRGASREDRVTKNSAIFSFIPTVITVLLIVGIIFIAWLLYQQTPANDSSSSPDNSTFDEVNKDSENDESNLPVDNNNNENNEEEENDNEENEENEEEEEIIDSDPEFSVVEIGTGASPISTLDLNNIGETIEVTLKFSGETYLQVVGDSGQSYLDGMYNEANSPQELSISGEERIHFNIGYSLHTDISIDGTDLEYPIAPEQNIHQKLWINLNKSE